ncbi:MAG: flagellar M-ring protein FliF, partial [Porphyrobacter sp. HL-46]
MAETSLPVAAPVTGEPAGLPAAPPQASWRTLLPEPVAGFIAQPALARALPALAGVGALAAAGMLWMTLASGPDRLLYSSLTDGERAKVVETLEAGGIGYRIDNATGALSVAEDDLYRARMLVASDAGIAAPQGASEMLDAMPLGTSRTLEGERLRLARERELMLTIREIDGIESVRVHLATPERSVFVRENNPPSASVMLRLVGGRSLSQSQVEAIVNLVAASVPGMSADAVRVVDQNGRLLSSPREEALDGLVLQREFEAKLREQIDALLLPLLGDGNYSAQVQVALDQNEVTSARETYEKDGAVRNESERNATRSGAGPVGGVPGVPANTPPPDAQ